MYENHQGSNWGVGDPQDRWTCSSESSIKKGFYLHDKNQNEKRLESLYENMVLSSNCFMIDVSAGETVIKYVA